MHTNTTYTTPGDVDPDALDQQIAEMYRDVANEAGRDLHFPTGRPLAEMLGYPADLLGRLPAQAVNSFAGVGYHLGLARLLSGERVLDLGSGSGMGVFAAAAQVGPAGSVTGVDIQVIQANSGYRFISERAQRTSDTYGAHSVSLLAIKPPTASRHASNPDLGGGARVAQAARDEAPSNTTPNQEVSK
jgi:hypothetical protein